MTILNEGTNAFSSHFQITIKNQVLHYLPFITVSFLDAFDSGQAPSLSIVLSLSSNIANMFVGNKIVTNSDQQTTAV